ASADFTPEHAPGRAVPIRPRTSRPSGTPMKWRRWCERVLAGGAALRHLYNRMLGQLYHCLQTDQTYDPIKAYGSPPTHPTRAAA
ncbi:MAG: hypothetical protein QOF66_147, partial [Mycobacterium sp.]|nr:hypothetical protein [Mycobacterium sp.]